MHVKGREGQGESYATSANNPFPARMHVRGSASHTIHIIMAVYTTKLASHKA